MDRKDEQHSHSESEVRVLIVDDHPIVRQGLIQLINQERGLVVCADVEDADQALEVLRKAQVDLAIVDISLAGMNGVQLTEKIKSEYPHLPVLIVTMHDELDYLERALRAGARGYVTKTEAAETIIAAINLILSGKDYISRRMVKGSQQEGSNGG
ncbi:MAG: response regulator [Planctomycetota bacterium]